MIDISAPAAKPGKANLIVTAGALTVLGLVGGGLVGKVIVGRLQGAAAPVAEAAATPPPYSSDTEVKELPAIVTNLADPPDTRVRLQVSIVYPKKSVEDAPMLMAQIGDDLVSFMKTETLANLEGATGIANLREDLNDRAATRSQGKVREVIIETLVLQ